VEQEEEEEEKDEEETEEEEIQRRSSAHHQHPLPRRTPELPVERREPPHGVGDRLRFHVGRHVRQSVLQCHQHVVVLIENSKATFESGSSYGSSKLTPSAVTLGSTWGQCTALQACAALPKRHSPASQPSPLLPAHA